MTRWNEHASGKDAERLMRYVAYDQGLPFHEWCDKYGIVSDARAKQIRRREWQPRFSIDTATTHINLGPKGQRGDPPHYETADWGPAPQSLTTDNVFEDERRQGRWKVPQK